MNTITGGLRSRLEGFEIDEPGVTLPFTARLARENGWTLAFAARVVREYKRFLFLTAEAGHAVTPSEEVDQAWHLHMVYTRSYWERLCGEVLGKALHHSPTEGGAAEGAKFREWYGRTLESYRAHFGEEPPEDIWPGVKKRFATAGGGRWVDGARYWLVPRPAWLPRLRRPLAALLTAGAVTAALLVPGCKMREVEWSPFDWRGGPFLLFYGISFIVCLLWSLRIKARRVAAFETGPLPVDPLTDIYEIAFLAGGGRRVMQTAVTHLCGAGALEYLKVGMWKRRLRATGATPQTLHPVERDILNTVRDKGGAKGVELTQLMGCAAGSLRNVENALALHGLRPLSSERALAGWATAGPLLLLLLVGGIKIVIGGVIRGRPVGYLVLIMIATLLTAVFIGGNLRRLTSAGESMLKTLRSLWRSAGEPKSTPRELSHGVALVGVAALMDVPGMDMLWADFRNLRQPDSGSSSSGSGCGSSGCSSGCSSSGCGSSGCGGGGCGGCGGGGD